MINLLLQISEPQVLPGVLFMEWELEKASKYDIIPLTELPDANNTWDLAERGAWLFYFYEVIVCAT